MDPSYNYKLINAEQSSLRHLGLVLGQIGSCKSSFINALLSLDYKKAKIASDNEQCTLQFNEYLSKDKKIALIDSIGNYGTKVTDIEWLKLFIQFIQKPIYQQLPCTIFILQCITTDISALLKIIKLLETNYQGSPVLKDSIIVVLTKAPKEYKTTHINRVIQQLKDKLKNSTHDVIYYETDYFDEGECLNHPNEEERRLNNDKIFKQIETRKSLYLSNLKFTQNKNQSLKNTNQKEEKGSKCWCGLC